MIDYSKDTERLEKLEGSLYKIYSGIRGLVIEDLEVVTCEVGDGEYRAATLREAIDAWIAADEKHV